MTTKIRSAGPSLGLLVALATLIVVATADKANAGPITPSDRMVVIGAPGGPVFDNSIPETGATAPESELTYTGGPASVPLPIPLATAIGLPGTSVLVLTEAPGAPPDPGETPIIVPGPNGNVVVSDLVLSTLGNQAGAPPFITFVSDGNPDLRELATLLPLTTLFIPETGALQDVTALLPPPVFPGIGPLTIQVQSDVGVPEPSSIVLMVLASVGLAAFARWKRSFRSA